MRNTKNRSNLSSSVSRLALAMALTAMAGYGAVTLSGVSAQPVSQSLDMSSSATLPNGAPFSFANLVQTVSPAVVSVKVERQVSERSGDNFRFGPDFFRDDPMPDRPRRGRRAQAMGSGFVIDADGYIVTNHHVIDGAGDITVVFEDGSERAAELVGQDPKTDLALLKVEATGSLPYVEFADSDAVQVGDWVVAVGNPFGLDGTVTTGIVSALNRDIGSGPYNDFIQIDAAINRGNSGGPAFNLQGEVVGVNTAIFSPSGGSVGIGFAISAASAAKVVADLKADGEVTRGWLGVYIQGLTDDLAESLSLDSANGAIVTNIVPNSPASNADLKTGDVITSVAGVPIENVRDLTRLVADLPVGEAAEFKIVRNGQAQSIDVQIDELKEEAERVALRSGNSEGGETTEGLGLELSTLDGQTARRLGLERDVEGVLVTDVAPYSEAAEKGLNRGDVILEVAGIRVDEPSEIVDLVKDAKNKNRGSVVMLVHARGGPRFVALNLGSS